MKFCELLDIRTQNRFSEQGLNRSHIPCTTFEHFETSVPLSGRKQENMNHVEDLQRRFGTPRDRPVRLSEASRRISDSLDFE